MRLGTREPGQRHSSTRTALYRALAGQLQPRGLRGPPNAKTAQQRKGRRPLRGAGDRVPQQPKLFHYYLIPKLVQGGEFVIGFVFLCTAVFATTALADMSRSSDVEDIKTYRNCLVDTSVDMLTDEVMYVLACGEMTPTGPTSITIALKDGTWVTALTKGAIFHFNDKIPVAFRIDKGELRRGQWNWNAGDMVAYTRDEQIPSTLLNELPAGRRIAIRIGEESGHVVLDGSAAAVKDFLSRIGRD